MAMTIRSSIRVNELIPLFRMENGGALAAAGLSQPGIFAKYAIVFSPSCYAHLQYRTPCPAQAAAEI
jgi:hypothetical protein